MAGSYFADWFAKRTTIEQKIAATFPRLAKFSLRFSKLDRLLGPMQQLFNNAVIVTTPSVHAVPVVVDSPHSGIEYPIDFRFAVDHCRLRQSEDTHVDTLYGAAPGHGATLI